MALPALNAFEPPMILDARTALPTARAYVVKLHRDAAPEQGELKGRLEHIPSGDHVDFDNADELLRWLLRHASTWDDKKAGAR